MPQTASKKKTADTTPRPTLLQCHDITVQFGGLKAIDNFSFSLQPNELHFLIGPNGAGKTTFLDVLCGKTNVKTGSVLFQEDVEITKLKEFEIARQGIVRKFQAPSVFPNLTVLEHLEIAVQSNKSLWHTLRATWQPAEKQSVQDMLDFIGLSPYRDKQAGQLAHGQKQWLEIGMVLMQNPQLVLLDEPIAGMTEEEEEKTGALLQKIAERCAVIVVEHDMDFVRKFSKKVTVMHEGKLLCDGTMADIQQNEKVVDVYLGRKGVEKDAAHRTT
jgi:urea transport system ATP-binding protein